MHAVRAKTLEGTVFWYLCNENNTRIVFHRLDGPAIERRSGANEWWLNGCKVKEEDIFLCTGKEEDLFVLKLKYGF
jgi:hypothetical protein